MRFSSSNILQKFYVRGKRTPFQRNSNRNYTPFRFFELHFNYSSLFFSLLIYYIKRSQTPLYTRGNFYFGSYIYNNNYNTHTNNHFYCWIFTFFSPRILICVVYLYMKSFISKNCKQIPFLLLL